MPDAADIPVLYDLDSYYTRGESHMRPVPPRFSDRVMIRLAWQVDHATPFDVDAVARRLPKNASILDIGCGDGELLASFRDRGFSVLGMDPDPEARAFAATRGLTILPGTAEDPAPELDDRQFDLVIMSHALEHCIDPTRAVATIRRLIASDGLAYIEVPNAGCIHFETFRQCSEMFDAPRHLWFFNAPALQRLTERMGLSSVAWYYNGFTRLFTPSWRGWECEIFDRLARRDLHRGATRHGRLQSLLLLARTAFAKPQRKYDSIGILLCRNAISTSP